MMVKNATCKLFKLITGAALLLWVNIAMGQELLREKMFIHADKNYYHSGEIAWLKIYVVDGTTNKAVNISKAVYVEVLDSANNPVVQQVVALDNGEGSGSFRVPAVQPGVYLLRGYTNWMKNFSPQLFFHEEIAIVNAQASGKSFEAETRQAGDSLEGRLRIGLAPDKKIYAPRSKVRIGITTSVPSGAPSPAHLSVAIYKMDSLVGRNPLSIASWFDDTARAVAGSLRYPPEYNGRMVTGIITEKVTGSPAPGVPVYLSAPGYSSGFYNCVSDAEGKIFFEMKEMAPFSSFIVKTWLVHDNIYSIQMDSPFFNGSTNWLEHAGFQQASHPATLLDHSIGAQVQEMYRGDEQGNFIQRTADSVPFFGRSDAAYQLDDYTRFSKMEEVFREYVAPVAVNRKDGKPQLNVYILNTHTRFDRGPLILLDGYPVTDVEKLFSFDPLKVKSIGVVSRRYFRNGDVFDGIVNMETYSHDMNGYPVTSSATVITNQNTVAERKFISPVYDNDSSRASRLPDYRNVLFWSPDIQTDNTGKQYIEFYTSDIRGTFVVEVQGLGINGEAGSSFTAFEVKR